KLAIVILLVAYASADVSHILGKAGEAGAQILEQEHNVGPQGEYEFTYKTENGISGQEQGGLKPVSGSDVAAETVQGESSYTAPDGQVIQLSYSADENGFVAR
ncbi:jg26004, partial [Pararge aegeria aegeria]